MQLSLPLIELLDTLQTLLRRHLGRGVGLNREVMVRTRRPMGRDIPDQVGHAISTLADDNP